MVSVATAAGVYRWGPYSLGAKGVSVGQVAAIIEGVVAERGICTALDVLQLAEDPNSPLHSFFTWDDAQAAVSFRLREAQDLIRHIRMVTSDSNITTPAFVHVELSNGRKGYLGVVRAMSEEELRTQVLEDAKRQIRAFQARFIHLSELAPIWAAVDQVLNPKPPKAKREPRTRKPKV